MSICSAARRSSKRVTSASWAASPRSPDSGLQRAKLAQNDTVNSMKRLQPVIWSKGTALTPQHLQNQDRFFESSLQFRINALAFRPWGFQDLEIDHQALAASSFALTRASGVLPDGLLFDIPDS